MHRPRRPADLTATVWGRLTLRERRQCRAKRQRQAMYERAKVSVSGERAEPVTGDVRLGRRGVERRLSAGDHVVLHRNNRPLVAGRTTSLRPVEQLVWRGLAIAIFGAAAVLIVGGPAGLLIALVGAVLIAAVSVVEFRINACYEEHGRLLTGEVTKVDESYDWVSVGYPPGMGARAYRLKIFYRFLTPAGEERAGSVTFTDKAPVRLRRATSWRSCTPMRSRSGGSRSGSCKRRTRSLGASPNRAPVLLWAGSRCSAPSARSRPQVPNRCSPRGT